MTKEKLIQELTTLLNKLLDEQDSFGKPVWGVPDRTGLSETEKGGREFIEDAIDRLADIIMMVERDELDEENVRREISNLGDNLSRH